MIRKKSIGVEKVRPAERIEQGFFLGIGDFKLMIAPTFNRLDSAAHLSPLGGHPLLMLFPRIEFEQVVERRLGWIRRDTRQHLRGGGGAPIKLRGRRFNSGDWTVASQ